jgi:glycolate oxidase iron-sulfur subunit
LGRAVIAAADSARIATLADQCVKCGLCLPHCPTYYVGRTEAESPRGRIAFAHALATGRMPATPALTLHLDQCLACMSCEPVCPSQVRYGELIVATRVLLRESDSRRRPRRALEWLLTRPRLLRVGLRLANLALLQRCLRSRVAQVMLRPFGLDRWARELPRLPRAESSASVRRRAPVGRGRVGLFLGCVASAVDRDVHSGARRLLAALGYEVVLPRGQGCCGALALHAGDAAAGKLVAATRHALLSSGVDTVLVSASGCFGTLRDALAGTAVRVREIHEFLAGDTQLAALNFRPLARRVALHTPCTQANVARAVTAIGQLLARIPRLEIAALPAAPRCCGAAGDYFLRHADIADPLRAETVRQTLALQPDWLVTSNVGCRIFLDNGLRQAGAGVPVTHPVVLLAQQLDN